MKNFFRRLPCYLTGHRHLHSSGYDGGSKCFACGQYWLSLSELSAVAIYDNQDWIADNILSHNALFRRLQET